MTFSKTPEHTEGIKKKDTFMYHSAYLKKIFSTNKGHSHITWEKKAGRVFLSQFMDKKTVSESEIIW